MFAPYRDAAPIDGQWDIALQAGVLSLFGMGISSKDLVNAGYTVELLTSYRTGAFSGFLRVHHQSSRLGRRIYSQLENARIGDRKVQVLAEYFKGPSPNGQFFDQSTDWLGLHLYH